MHRSLINRILRTMKRKIISHLNSTIKTLIYDIKACILNCLVQHQSSKPNSNYSLKEIIWWASSTCTCPWPLVSSSLNNIASNSSSSKENLQYKKFSCHQETQIHFTQHPISYHLSYNLVSFLIKDEN